MSKKVFSKGVSLTKYIYYFCQEVEVQPKSKKGLPKDGNLAK